MKTVRHWSSHQSEIKAHLRGRSLALFLDFDGTLVPLRPYEKEANLSSSMRSLLEELASHPAVQVSIVSGRPLKDLRRQIKHPRIYLAGNHGFEIEGPRMKFLHPSARKAKSLFRPLRRELGRRLTSFSGISIEDKTYTLSIHYRGSFGDQLGGWLRSWLRKHSEGARFSLHTGKNVFEVKPRARWHKGAAMRKILSALPGKQPMAVYVGDDLTDEDALRRLPATGWGFKVASLGAGGTAARSYLRNPAEVKKCLLWFKSLVK